MAGSKLASRGTAYFAVISTINLLVIMAAIANDGSVGNFSTPLPTSVPTSVQLSTFPSKPLPSVSSLIRGPGYDAIIKIASGGKDPIIRPTPGVGGPGKPPQIIRDNSTMSTLIDYINSSSTNPFTTQNWTEVRAQYKSNALLPCHVRNFGDGVTDGVTVSWIRRKDYHLLTVGLQTYSSDDRFQAIHSQSPDDSGFSLQIKYVQLRDAGVYECILAAHPPSSVFVTLNVVEVRAEIVGGPEKIYKAGSTVELKCDLHDSTEEPEYVFWYQGLEMINYDRSRHINVTHYKSSSVLILHNVQKSDSGVYTCLPANAKNTSIFVHIINGENPAAMQHGSHSTSCVPCPPLWFLSFLLSLTLQALYFRFMSNHVDRYHERALCTITSDSLLSTPKQKNHNQQSPNHCHHKQPFYHNQRCHHLFPSQSTPVVDRDTSSCHRFSKNDQNHPAPRNELMLATHYECCCGEESEKRCSVYTDIPAPSAAEFNQKSGTRSSVSSDSNFVLCCRSEGRQRAPFLPATAHSSRLTVR